MKENTIKRFAVAALALLFAASCLAGVLFGARRATAATVTNTVLSEPFDSLEDAGNWQKNDFGLTRENYYVALNGPVHDYESTLMYRYAIDGDCTISFRVEADPAAQTDGNSDNWIGFHLGSAVADGARTSDSTVMFISWQGRTVAWDNDGGRTGRSLDSSTEGSNPSLNYSMFGYAEGNGANVEIVLHKTETVQPLGDNLPVYELDYYLWETGTAKPSAPSFEMNDVAVEGYFGFTSFNNYLFRIYDMQVTEGGTVVSSADLETEGSAIGYDDGDGTYWRANSAYNTGIVSVAADTKVSTAGKAAGMLLSSLRIEADPYCNRQFDLSFAMTAPAFPEGAVFGVGFGLYDTASAADERNLIGIQGLADGGWRFVKYANGRVRASSSAYAALPSGGQTFTVTGFYGGTVSVSFGGQSEIFEDVDFAGCFAVGTAGTAACAVSFDDISLTAVSRVAPEKQPEDLAIDFTGTLSNEDGGVTYYSKYIDVSKWHYTTNVSLPRYSLTEDRNYIQFIAANKGGTEMQCDIFAPRTRFEEFICRFSITVSEEAAIASANAAVGLSFGKASLIYTPLESSPGVFFERTASGMRLKVQGGDCEQANQSGEIAVEGDLWASEDTVNDPVTYRVMVVVRGGTANVYFAPEDSPEQMNILRARLTGLSTYGFVGVVGYNGASFHLNDFSVTNIAVVR